MKSRHFLLMNCAVALLAGCVAQPKTSPTPRADFCAISDPMFFKDEGVVQWLSENDPAILERIVVHNEQVERICS